MTIRPPISAVLIRSTVVRTYSIDWPGPTDGRRISRRKRATPDCVKIGAILRAKRSGCMRMFGGLVAVNLPPLSFVVILCVRVRRVSVSGRTQSRVSSSLRRYKKPVAKVAHFFAPAAEAIHSLAHRGNELHYLPQAAWLASDSLLVLPAPKSQNQVSHSFLTQAPDWPPPKAELQ